METNAAIAHKRAILKVELLPKARERLVEIPDAFGMTHVAVTSNLILWFAKQSDVIQARILGLYPVPVSETIIEMILKEMMNEEKTERKRGEISV